MSSLITHFPAEKPIPDVVISPQIGLLFHNLLIHRFHQLVALSIAKLLNPCTSFTCINPPHRSHKTQTIIDSFQSPTSSAPKSLLRTRDQVDIPDHIHIALALGVHIMKRSYRPAIRFRFRFRNLCGYGCACCGWGRMVPLGVAMAEWGRLITSTKDNIQILRLYPCVEHNGWA